jgi:hypothetical protein
MADPGVAKDRELASWRRRLLPLMSGVLLALTGVFVLASFWQIHDIQQRIDAPDHSAADSVFKQLEQQIGSGRVTMPAGYAGVRIVAALETDALSRRYRHASSALLARTWTRYMGFLTGMIMALVGAAFVLGRLEEGETQFTGEAQGAKWAFITTSPGLILAALGSGLMLTALIVKADVDVKDGSAYAPLLSAMSTRPASGAAAVDTMSVDDLLKNVPDTSVRSHARPVPRP